MRFIMFLLGIFFALCVLSLIKYAGTQDLWAIVFLSFCSIPLIVASVTSFVFAFAPYKDNKNDSLKMAREPKHRK